MKIDFIESSYYERVQKCFVCDKKFVFDKRRAKFTTHPIGGEYCYEVKCPYCNAIMLTAVSIS